MTRCFKDVSCVSLSCRHFRIHKSYHRKEIPQARNCRFLFAVIFALSFVIPMDFIRRFILVIAALSSTRADKLQVKTHHIVLFCPQTALFVC